MKLTVITLLLCASLMAQDKKSAVTPPAPPLAAKSADIPVPPSRALAIRDAQVEALNVQTQVQQLLQQRDDAQKKMQQAIKDAYAESKLSDKDYQIDDRRWVFVSVAKPPAASTQPTQPAAGAKK
jgi:hypothetical protein